MGKTILEILAAIVLFDLLLFAFLLLTHRTREPEQMPRFPSYDWDVSDEITLALISANTTGTERMKQQAVIDVLQEVWETGTPIGSAAQKRLRDEDNNPPAADDFRLVDMVKAGIWADE